MRGFGVTVVRVAIIGGFFFLWEIASGRWIEPFLISSPSRIFTSLISGFRDGDLLQHTWVTFEEIAIGFPVGAISGIALGYAFGRSRTLAEIFEPIIVALNGIPAHRRGAAFYSLAGNRSLVQSRCGLLADLLSRIFSTPIPA